MTTELVYQCGSCLRYFSGPDDALALIIPQPRFISCVPICCDCGRADCAAVVAEIKRLDDVRLQRHVDKRNLKNCPPAGNAPKAASTRFNSAHAPAGATFIRSSCPADTEFLPDPVMEAADRMRDSGGPAVPVATPDHRTQVEEFGARGEAKNQNELMLHELRKSFDEHHPEIPGKWVNNARLKFELKIGCPNNRAMDLRGGKRVRSGDGWRIEAPHAFIERYNLDVDCSQIENSATETQHFAYRLCLKSQSERLKREAQKSGRKVF